VSSNSSNNFSITRLARQVSTYTTLAGLTFSGIRHRDDVVAWLQQSYDRQEILKDFARLKVSQTAATPSTAPEVSERSSPEASVLAGKESKDEKVRQPTPQASEQKAEPVASGMVAQFSKPEISSVSESHTEPRSSATTSTPSLAVAPNPVSQDDILRTSYLELRQRYQLLHGQFEEFQAGYSWRQPAEIARVASRFKESEQYRVLLEEELAAGRYGERYKGALQALSALVAVVEPPLQIAAQDARVAQEYRNAHERLELFHLGRSAITDGVDANGLIAGIRYFKAARMDGPLNIAAKVELATLYHMLGRNDEALVEALRAIDSEDGEVIPSPHDIPEWKRSAALDTYMLLGRLYLTVEGGQDHQRATEAFQRAHDYATNSTQIRDIGSELVRCNKPKEALRIWGGVLNASPDAHPEIWKEFIAVGGEPEQQETFVELVHQIADAHEDSPAAQRALVSVELPAVARLADRLVADIESFEKATQGPLPAEVILAKQSLASGQEEIKTISATLRTVGPDGTPISGSLSGAKTTFLQAGELFTKASEHAQTAHELVTRFDESHLRERAKSLIDSERNPKIRQAIAYLKAARMLHDGPVVSNNLGVAYKALGQYDEAKIELLRAIIAAPLQEPGFYRNFLDYCERAVAKGDRSRYDEMKSFYLSEAEAGNAFMARYAAATYYSGKSQQRTQEWLEMAADAIAQGHAANVSPELVADCEARLRAFR
jgi:tetratricopeptide (TPR) repeat protein